MNPVIKAAFEAWQKAESKVNGELYERQYKAATAYAKRKYKVFNDLCVANGLDTSKTAYDLMGMKDTVITRAKQ